MYLSLLSKYAFTRPSQGKRLVGLIKSLIPQPKILKSSTQKEQAKNHPLSEDYLSFDNVVKLDPTKIINLSKMQVIRRPSMQGKRLEQGQHLIQGSEKMIQKLKTMENIIKEILQAKNSRLTEKQIELLKQHKKILQTRSAQLVLTLYLIQNQNSGESLRSSYDALSEPLGKLHPSFQSVKNGINVTMLQNFLPKQTQYLKQYLENLQALKQHSTDKQISEYKLQYLINNCQISAYKINLIIEYYPYACRAPLDDLFSQNQQTSQRWKDLQQNITVKALGDRQDVSGSFKSFQNQITRMFAVASTLDEVLLNPYSIKSTWNSLFRGDMLEVMECILDLKKAERKAKLFRLSPSKDLLTLIFNADNTVISKFAIGFGLPSIKYSQVLYLPRHFPQISPELVSNWVKNQNFGILDKPIKIQEKMISDLKKYTTELVQAKYDEDKHVMIRINSPYNLESQYSSFAKSIKGITDAILGDRGSKTVDSVIFQIHGGGFICQNSFIHQMYLRPMSKNLNIPIISVDYRLSPEYKYPAALDDCFQAYMWVVKYFDMVFKNTGRNIKILMTGDSAGGNLSAALTGLAIKLGVRVPDSLVLVYPALNLNVRQATPSQFQAFEDFLLPLSVLKVCRDAYIDQDKHNAELDPFISPILLSDEILQKFPKTRIFVGEKDSLTDDSYRLTDKLKTNKVDVTLTVYEQFVHGFMQFDSPVKKTKYCHYAMKDIETAMRELLQNK